MMLVTFNVHIIYFSSINVTTIHFLCCLYNTSFCFAAFLQNDTWIPWLIGSCSSTTDWLMNLAMTGTSTTGPQVREVLLNFIWQGNLFCRVSLSVFTASSGSCVPLHPWKCCGCRLFCVCTQNVELVFFYFSWKQKDVQTQHWIYYFTAFYLFAIINSISQIFNQGSLAVTLFLISNSSLIFC